MLEMQARQKTYLHLCGFGELLAKRRWFHQKKILVSGILPCRLGERSHIKIKRCVGYCSSSSHPWTKEGDNYVKKADFSPLYLNILSMMSPLISKSISLSNICSRKGTEKQDWNVQNVPFQGSKEGTGFLSHYYFRFNEGNWVKLSNGYCLVLEQTDIIHHIMGTRLMIPRLLRSSFGTKKHLLPFWSRLERKDHHPRSLFSRRTKQQWLYLADAPF